MVWVSITAVLQMVEAPLPLGEDRTERQKCFPIWFR
jgi:hypothetical protein